MSERTVGHSVESLSEAQMRRWIHDYSLRRVRW